MDLNIKKILGLDKKEINPNDSNTFGNDDSIQNEMKNFEELSNASKNKDTILDVKKNSLKTGNMNGPFSSLKKKLNGTKDGVLNGIQDLTKQPSENKDFQKPLEVKSEEEIFVDNSFKEIETKPRSTDSFSEIGFNKNYRKIPFVGNLPPTRQYQIGIVFAILAISSIVLGGFLYGNATIKENKSIQFSTEFSSDLQKINTLFSQATLGKNQAYGNLVKIVEKTKNDFKSLQDYNSSIKDNEQLQSIQNKIQQNLNQIDKNINVLSKQGDILINSSEKVNEFNENINQINSDINTFVNLYIQQSINQNELLNAYSLKTNLQTINGSLATILLSEKINTNSIDVLNKARQEFKTSLVSLQVGNSSKGINAISQPSLLNSYQIIAKNWIKLSGKVDVITNKSAELIKIRELAPQNETLVNSLTNNINDMLTLYKSNDLTGVQLAKFIIFMGIIFLILALIITFYVYSYEKDNRSFIEKVENDKNSKSIVKLLTELIPLQDGDLTKKTTVTDEITGAIADSINATIDSLASLVKKIKDTSFVMRKKTSEVNLISLDMLKATEKQASSLNQTGAEVINIANAITEISTKTEKGAEEAQKSVKVSEEGAKQVQDSVKSMREINHNMNETVHLMQKVGNSSKQISEIVELLSDITEATSILALNATVQAAKAGDAGKGFKIVADSIQELADKASEETRRVGALISAVQTDITAVEKAVQKTTDEVDNGVRLSELAGHSLNKITLVSRELSQIVAAISEDAKSHADSAKKVSESMQEILKTTEENKNSTEKTANSISEISEISNELGDSVQSFKVE